MEEQNDIQVESSNETATYTDDFGISNLKVLKAFAWIYIVVGIISAMVVWSNFGQMEVSAGIYSTYTTTEANPIGIGIGFGILAQSIVFGTLMLAVGKIGENVILLLMRQKDN